MLLVPAAAEQWQRRRSRQAANPDSSSNDKTYTKKATYAGYRDIGQKRTQEDLDCKKEGEERTVTEERDEKNENFIYFKSYYP